MKTRVIKLFDVITLVEHLCIEANCVMTSDIKRCLEKQAKEDKSMLGRDILNTLLQNAEIAQTESSPMCQDTGMTVVFVRVGQDVIFDGGFIGDAINQGVRQGYEKGFLRKSVVSDPLKRINTNDNTPAVIHYDVVAGDELTITVAPKGFGSENKSQLKMLTPSQGLQGVKDFILDVISEAGANPCPPIIVGVGIGGTMERCAYLAKKALLREVGSINSDEQLASLEKDLLAQINQLGIGPAGFGGSTTAMAVHIITEATHIAGLPVAVNIGCHATRHAEGKL
ncbi:fumarate hydratase [Bacteroides propionicifaciens]|jgi:fumarate hydratase subunit alpha|uniref:fumarate hydratase n=1 Tax=Bacteroides propionicifaciens TaxID=392838 RepID=UPI000372CB97|nr:fumarate hydratase [Bacteroides propionicifaciens]